ncbi:MAG: collagen-like protein [Bacteroidia bacterium]|nr:collagen-like protein [Bacteroidia bacterium]
MKISRILWYGFTALLYTSTVSAQSPDSINYQAIARNAAGAELPNKTISVKFLIHHGVPGGTVVYTDTHPSVTTNSFGLFTLYIGQTPGLRTVNWATGPYFLEVDIDTTGSNSSYITMGNTQFVSVPYSYFSRFSGIADSALHGPKGDSGARGPQGPKGDTGATGLLRAGTAPGQTPFWNGSSWIINSNIFNNGNRVGIKTVIPNSVLQVIGRACADTLMMPRGAAAGYLLQSDAAGNGNWVSPSSLKGFWMLAPNNIDILNRGAGASNVIVGIKNPPAAIQNFQVYDSNGNGGGGINTLNPNTANPSLLITNNGKGYGLNVSNNNIANTQAAINVTAQGTSAPAIYAASKQGYGIFINAGSPTNANALLYAQNGGAGYGGWFYNTPSANINAAVFAQNDAKGAAAQFNIANASANPSSTLISNNSYTGSAGFFQISNTGSSGSAIFATTNGSGGAAIDAQYTGSGSADAGYFSNSSAAGGYAGYFSATGNATGGYFQIAGGSYAVQGYVTGSAGEAGNFTINNANSGMAAVYGTTNGFGSAASFLNGTANSATLVTQNTTPGGKAIQIIDGNQANGRILVSDATGNGTWSSPSIFHSDVLNNVGSFAITNSNLIFYTYVYNKTYAGTNLEISANFMVSVAGTWGSASAVLFQILVDGGSATYGTGGTAYFSTQSGDIFMNTSGVFAGLPVGNHTITIVARTNLAPISLILSINPGNYASQVITKETW